MPKKLGVCDGEGRVSHDAVAELKRGEDAIGRAEAEAAVVENDRRGGWRRDAVHGSDVHVRRPNEEGRVRGVVAEAGEKSRGSGVRGRRRGCRRRKGDVADGEAGGYRAGHDGDGIATCAVARAALDRQLSGECRIDDGNAHCLLGRGQVDRDAGSEEAANETHGVSVAGDRHAER